MKRIKLAITVILSACMLVALTACGGGGTPAPAGSGSGAAPAPAAGAITIRFVNANTETSAKGATLNKMLDYIEENTNGTVVFDRLFGGAVCTADEEYAFLKDGAFDMCCPEGSSMMSSMPFSYGCTTNEGWDKAYEMWNTIYNDDPEIAPIVQKYFAQDGIKVLGPVATGGGCVVSKFEVTSNEDVKGHKMGAIVYADYWESVGASVVNTTPMDLYESLSRGVYDCVGFAMSAYKAMSLNEVAPYVLGGNEMQTNGDVLIRQEVWDQLTPEQQKVFEDGAKVLWDTCVENALADEEAVKEIATYHVLDIEDAKQQSGYMEKTVTIQLLTFAENLYGEEGKADMLKVRTKEAEMNGLDMLP